MLHTKKDFRYFKAAGVLFICLLIAFTGCVQTQNSCIAPYVKIGDNCCLDKNNDGVCDNQESTQQKGTPIGENASPREDVAELPDAVAKIFQGTTVQTNPTKTTTPSSGLQVVSSGTIVKVDYIGKFENGTVFDTSIQAEAQKAGIYNGLRAYEPLSFVPGSGSMIPGFENGVLGMHVGESKTITVPPGQGYTGSNPMANETLIFDVTIKSVSEPQKLDVLVVNDKRCTTCDVTGLMTQLTPMFPGMTYKVVDYSTPEGKQLYTDSGLSTLPAILFTNDVKTADGYTDVQTYLVPAGKYLSLNIGADYNPACFKADGTVDCQNPLCSKDVSCMSKLDKPTVELFVMSSCPYGTQMEKGMMPVADLLKDKIDYQVKFCTYSMHGQAEVNEEMQQYCIENQFKDKYLPYLKCYLNASKSADCEKAVGIDDANLKDCIAKTDTQFSVTKNYNDKSTWLSGQFPLIDMYKADNEKYNVQGSPTFVVNGIVLDKTGRDPESLLTAICNGFKTKPSECSQNLSSATPSAGFGYATDTTGAASTGAGCGV